MNQKHSRRKFINKLALGAAAVYGAPNLLLSRPSKNFKILKSPNKEVIKYSANDNIQIAVIGAGGMGTANVNTALKFPGVTLVAACDLYDGRLDAAKERWGKQIFTTKDYREVLDKEDIDAVIIGTPDFWHKDISIEAMKKGKSVYCEKPMIHSIEEGYELVKTEKETKKIFQVGSQGLSSLGNEKAKELLEQGAIGQLNYAEGFWARNSPLGAWQYAIPKDASEVTVDWERYLGKNTKIPFDAKRFFRWRNYLDYGTGMSGDLFVHLFSSLHFITSSFGPEKIVAMGGLRFWKDGREVPDVLLGTFNYPETKSHPGFDLSLRCNFVDGTSGTTYLRLVGSEGSMNVEWDRIVLRTNEKNEPVDEFSKEKLSEAESSLGKRKKMLEPSETIYQAEEGYWGAHFDHHRNFLEGIRTGKPVVEDSVFGFRAAAPALACNNSYFENKIIHWDPEKMELK